MAEKKQAEEAERETEARTELITVRLNDIGENRERYCHRDPEALSEAKLKPFAEQLVREGLQVPIEVADEPPGSPKSKMLLKGYRRVAALNLNVRLKVPGFTADMEVTALRVLDATPKDLLVRSVSDNENRQNLSVSEKIRACKTLYDEEVPAARAASAMGISLSSFDRSLTIASTPWIFDLVAQGVIDPTPAYLLLTAAKKAGRLRELKEDLTLWVTQIGKEIEEKARRKAEAGKELSEAERQIKRYLKAHLLAAWRQALKAKQRFGEITDLKWRYGAELDAEAKKLTIPGVNLNLSTAKFADLAEVAAKLDSLASAIRPYLAMRQNEERLLAGNRSGNSTAEYLKKIGLGESVSLLNSEPAAKDVENVDDETDEAEPRLERELSGKIELPDEQETARG